MLQSCLLCETVQLAATDTLLVLNSAADPFVSLTIQQLHDGTVILAEDNIATLKNYTFSDHVRHVAFQNYILHSSAASVDVAVMNLLYQPSKEWMLYGLHIAAYALKTGGQLYIVGAKDRGILSIAKHMEEQFGNVETLTISKGHRVLSSRKTNTSKQFNTLQAVDAMAEAQFLAFAEGKLDDGTRLLLQALEVRTTDEALDLGCGAGFIGLHIARLARKGQVTMVDSSLAAVVAARQAVEQSGLTNVRVLPSDGVQAIISQRFDLVATNPPFHQGGIQTMNIAERFIRDAAQVLRPQGRFYLVANRFLKYEPTLRTNFKQVEEVRSDSRYKVLLATQPQQKQR